MTLIDLARKLRPLIEQAAQSLDEKTASDAPQLFGKMKKDGSLIKAGTRLNFDGVLKIAQTDLWDTDENTPDKAPTLWKDTAYKDGFRVIPSVITVTEAFAKGERGWWMGELYESLIDANVYTPVQYPQGWQRG